MTYKINDKQYSEFDINKRCAELMGIELNQAIAVEEGICVALEVGNYSRYLYNPYKNPSDTLPIIEKCWDELMSMVDTLGNESLKPSSLDMTKWEYLILKHNCTKLVAACICLIEMAGE